MTTEYSTNHEYDSAVALVYINTVKPTKKDGSKYKVSEGGNKYNNPVIHIMASSKHILKDCSQAMLAAHEYVNNRDPTSLSRKWNPSSFEYDYPEKDITNKNYMIEKASKDKQNWRDGRRGVRRSIRLARETNSSQLDSIALATEQNTIDYNL